MRLDEWQRYIDSEFVRGSAVAANSKNSAGPSAALLDSPSEEAVEAHPAIDSEYVLGAAELPAPPQAAQVATTLDELPASEHSSSITRSGDEADANSRNLSPESASAAPSLLSTDHSHTHSLEPEIAPFAEYIAVRQKASLVDSSAGESDSDSDAVPSGEVSPAGSLAAQFAAEPVTNMETDRIARSSLPLELTAETANTLRLLSTAKLPGTDEAEGNREELLRRLRDPILTPDETALLLGVSMPALKRITDRGSLVPYSAIVNETLVDVKQMRDGKQRQFQLSNILAWLAANSSELAP